MPEADSALVINTTPLITLAVGLGHLEPLRYLYSRVLVPQEVEQEMLAQGKEAPGAEVFVQASWLTRMPEMIELPPFLKNSLDAGEAAVIQTALAQGVERVAIDETVGRRVARLNGLQLTGSLGIMIKAHHAGLSIDAERVLERLHHQGIWLSASVRDFFVKSIARD